MRGGRLSASIFCRCGHAKALHSASHFLNGCCGLCACKGFSSEPSVRRTGDPKLGLPVACDQTLDERGFPRARRARQSDPAGPAEDGVNVGEQALEAGPPILDHRDRAGQGGGVAGPKSREQMVGVHAGKVACGGGRSKPNWSQESAGISMGGHTLRADAIRRTLEAVVVLTSTAAGEAP